MPLLKYMAKVYVKTWILFVWKWHKLGWNFSKGRTSSLTHSLGYLRRSLKRLANLFAAFNQQKFRPIHFKQINLILSVTHVKIWVDYYSTLGALLSTTLRNRYCIGANKRKTSLHRFYEPWYIIDRGDFPKNLPIELCFRLQITVDPSSRD